MNQEDRYALILATGFALTLIAAVVMLIQKLVGHIVTPSTVIVALAVIANLADIARRARNNKRGT